jgi:nicotinate-nucleotide pyrophosphorylase (carboxylating)
MGGALNHRMGLYDGILIKDNHIQTCGGVGQAVNRMKEKAPHLLKIEVEVANIDQTKEAIAAGADVIMLDNMNISEMEEAMAVINKRALVEVSGNISRSKLKQLADLGVDIISIGALTHSARSVDLSMNIKPAV